MEARKKWTRIDAFCLCAFYLCAFYLCNAFYFLLSFMHIYILYFDSLWSWRSFIHMHIDQHIPFSISADCPKSWLAPRNFNILSFRKVSSFDRCHPKSKLPIFRQKTRKKPSSQQPCPNSTISRNNHLIQAKIKTQALNRKAIPIKKTLMIWKFLNHPALIMNSKTKSRWKT